jgi:hypothetical protein
MAARTRPRRGGRGRPARGRGGGRAQPGGPAALVSRVTGMLGGGTGRRGTTAGSGLASRAASFVRGFMSGGGPARRGRGRRRY